ncbi:MAG: alpha/beta fold hydrolase [Alphaproteobacteria bacterium]|nr:MAG: alpha/beta fold hydrolase [Alphaproteobacteria bacterium]
MTAPEFLATTDGRRIAYHKTPASGEGARLPGLVFLGGFRSDMTGTKALFLEERARAAGRAFLRFDYTGHGASSGDFLDGTIGGWARDAADVLAALTEGPQILIGSSMGGWIALLTARAMPDRVAGMVGIAAAPDFTEDSMWAGFTPAQRQTLLAEGRIALPSAYSEEPYIITRRLIEDGRRHLVLRAPLPLPFPVRLLHGTADADVPVAVALRLIDHADGPDIRLTLVKGAGHRFSEPPQLELIWQAAQEVAAAA